jgi:hypothetical protein
MILPVPFREAELKILHAASNPLHQEVLVSRHLFHPLFPFLVIMLAHS